MLLTIVRLQLSLHLTMLSLSFGGRRVVLVGLRHFVTQGIQNEGCCISSDTVYCWENSEECAEKGMTQNSKHNRFLSAPADQC